MKYLIAGLFLIFAGSPVYAQISISLPVSVEDTAPLGQTFVLTFGVDSRATNCLDTALDERDLPPPPPGFLPVITPGCTDSNSGTPVTLHKDYRAIPPDSTIFSRTYRCVLYRGENRKPVRFHWNDLSSGIDSAKIWIEFIDTVNMRTQSEYVLNNEFVNELFVTIYYHLPAVDVREPDVAGTLHLFPVPARETLSVQAAGYEEGRYEVYSIDGRQVLAGVVPGKEFVLHIGTVPAGLYFLRLYDKHGGSETTSFVRQ